MNEITSQDKTQVATLNYVHACKGTHSIDLCEGKIHH